MNNLAPIVLIVYNRPEHTRKTVEALQKNALAKDSELFVFSDAPKNEMTAESVRQVREYIHKISGFKNVHIVEREKNLGVDPSILDAVNTMFEKYDKIIRVEDDIVTVPNFLQFMNKALDVFENDDRIWGISGFTPLIKIPQNYDKEILLMPRDSSWGDGTWKNRWNAVDFNIKIDYETVVGNPQIKKIIGGAGEDILGTIHKYPNTYDIPIHYYMRMNNKYTVCPTYSLVKNIGTDGTGEHFTIKQKRYDIILQNNITPIKINADIEPDEYILKQLRKYFTKPLWRKILIFLAQKTGVYNFLLKKLG
ncbi:MAG: glycosyltransferase [Bacteroidales bacterium]|jgi:hypothetical protein|nr:glycosyltransferase [Bacteroidales bacterium]